MIVYDYLLLVITISYIFFLVVYSSTMEIRTSAVPENPGTVSRDVRLSGVTISWGLKYLLRTAIKYYEDLGNFQKIQYAVKQHYF